MLELLSIGLIGIISSFLGTLVGGGALITLPALLLLGVPVHASIASNKLSAGLGALSGVSYVWRTKQLAPKDIFTYLALALAGGIAGAAVTSSIDEAAMQVAAIVLLLGALIVTFMNRHLWAAEQTDEPAPPSWKSRLAIVLIALYDGGFGPGSTTFGILHFMRSRWSYAKAAQMTRVVILGSNIGGFLVFYGAGYIDWAFALSLGAGSMIGSQLGMRALPKVPLKLARAMLTTVVVGLIVTLSYDLLHRMI